MCKICNFHCDMRLNEMLEFEMESFYRQLYNRLYCFFLEIYFLENSTLPARYVSDASLTYLAMNIIVVLFPYDSSTIDLGLMRVQLCHGCPLSTCQSQSGDITLLFNVCSLQLEFFVNGKYGPL